jgi:Mitochondrial K+-H+ exchange-related
MDARGTQGMQVYLVPVGATAYELYCEAEGFGQRSAVEGSTLWGRLVGLFHRALAEGDEERRRAPSDARPPRGRVRRAVTRRLAEAVAEQRLLWHLRHETSARLVHADDLAPARALDLTRANLAADCRRHRRWWIIDGLLALASTPIALLPGPNLLAYYFLVRVVGHYYSMRGARQGLDLITWETEPSTHLTLLRGALALDRQTRDQQVGRIALALGLTGLQRFVDGLSSRPS